MADPVKDGSKDAKVPVVEGTNTAFGVGILGVGKVGVVGTGSAPTTDFSKEFFSVGVQGSNARPGPDPDPGRFTVTLI
jgi:hypothetical protein